MGLWRGFAQYLMLSLQGICKAVHFWSGNIEMFWLMKRTFPKSVSGISSVQKSNLPMCEGMDVCAMFGIGMDLTPTWERTFRPT